MKRTYNKWLKWSALGLLTVFGMYSCTDDHFDVSATNAQGTLWENIAATQKCDSFMQILQKTIVNKKEYGAPATLSYAGLFQSNKAMTVWAPQDGTYNAAHWLNLLEEGNNEDVETQFVKNHFAYSNYNGSFPVVRSIRLANGKFVNYDDSSAVNTFNGVNIVGSAYKNIASTNGTVHLLETYSPFAYNLRQMLANYDDLSVLYNYIESRDTLVFLESSSTPGTIVDGKIQYVDSVFMKYNKVLPYISQNEDSLSAAIYPSNTAWAEALEKVAKSYNYKNHYAYYDVDEVLNLDTVDVDSVREIRTINAIFNNMFYSLNEQPGFNVNTASAQTVGDFFKNADSLVSTVYYNSTYLYHQHAPQCRELAEGKTPNVASNGYGFITDHFNFKANKAWQFDIEFDGEDSWLVNKKECKNVSSASPTGTSYRVTTGTVNDSVKGTVHGQIYRSFTPSNSSSKPVVTYNIPNVLSGTYDIYVVLVPENMIDSSNHSPKHNQFTATLASDFTEGGKATTTDATNSDGKATFVSDATKVDTILLFKDFKFPYAFYGLSHAKPYISLKGDFKNSDLRKDVTAVFNIDEFILRSKDE